MDSTDGGRLPPEASRSTASRPVLLALFGFILAGSVIAWLALLPALSPWLPSPGPVVATDGADDEAHRIWVAVDDGDVEYLRSESLDTRLIDEPVQGMTALMKAASLGSSDMVRALLHHGADPNRRGMAERTALQYAAERNRIEVAKLLLDAGADIDGSDTSGLTPLIMCADRGYTEFALMLMSRGADINARMAVGWTPLLDAAHRGNLKLASALIAAGADTGATINGHDMVSLARTAGHESLARYLATQ